MAALAAFPFSFHSDRSLANARFEIRDSMVEGAHESGMTNMLNVCYTLVRFSFEGLTRETEPVAGMMELVQCLGRCQTRQAPDLGRP